MGSLVDPRLTVSGVIISIIRFSVFFSAIEIFILSDSRRIRMSVLVLILETYFEV